jgi:hypothetical protein
MGERAPLEDRGIADGMCAECSQILLEQGRKLLVRPDQDHARLPGKRGAIAKPSSAPLALSCTFQEKRRSADGKEVILCTLALGACPVQVKQTGPEGGEVLACSQPRGVLTDWQIVNVE